MFGQTRNPYSVSPIKSKQSIPQQKEHSMASDIEIAQKARLERISKIALAKLGIPEEHLEPYGHFKAKVSLDYLDGLKARPNAKLVLVTAMTPTTSFRSEEHTSELQSPCNLVCRLLLEKKKQHRQSRVVPGSR